MPEAHEHDSEKERLGGTRGWAIEPLEQSRHTVRAREEEEEEEEFIRKPAWWAPTHRQPLARGVWMGSARHRCRCQDEEQTINLERGTAAALVTIGPTMSHMIVGLMRAALVGMAVEAVELEAAGRPIDCGREVPVPKKGEAAVHGGRVGIPSGVEGSKMQKGRCRWG